ncbi:phage tail length tape-measure protein 1 [Klebsiella michiganensis]|uniref:phage tail length tape-measure protein 1 n=1 Tax=Klebsiella michiganensis TaxID=1134687 RepID=UPI00026BBAC8|nr:phage tail length tape-measure protein 1 [Klebsiella michiganensis]CAH6304341.1 Chromosome partition protein Smc [Klebsiella oxytoca]AFN31211.1 Phage tail length tape-measure protein 1 [Klebsiella michiganensis E718]ASK76105.1 tail protein (tape measure) [Klebsiella michiganensis]ASZ54701.1 tail protein (tape measure) [Klebsiella michiganensis]MBG2660236.1 tail protein (tape measure) [Klebsiella michiganensis]
MSNNFGNYYIEIDADVLPFLKGMDKVQSTLDALSADSKNGSKAFDNLSSSASSAGTSFNELAVYARSMDGSLKSLNTNVNAITRAMQNAGTSTAGVGSEFTRAEAILESLGNQLAVLDEAQENGARSAAVLAAQLRAGSKATEEEKQKIGELTGRLYDMKTGVDTGAKSHGTWKNSVQQAGYQVQDFIIQVQGGQSALVAFAQQGSQLAGAFGAGGAVVGAVIALSSVVAGALITSLNGGKNAMDSLKDAAETMDKVITISNQGVAALSDKYAVLARTNADVATILRNQALLEYNNAIAKIPKAISDASNSFVTLGERAVAALGGASPSIKKFNDELAALEVTAGNWGDAIQQANSKGQHASGIVSSLSATVGSLSSRLSISRQAAFDLAKQLSDLSNNPTPEALQKVIVSLQSMKTSTKEGQDAVAGLVGTLNDLWIAALNAKQSIDSVSKATDNLTAGQKNLIQQSERSLALSKLQGEARARLQAQFAAEDSGFAKDDPHTKQMENDAAATYRNTQAQKDLKSQQTAGATAAESIAQKLANLKQQAELAAGSTQELSRESAMLRAEQSLGKSASADQIQQARTYAAAVWDTTAALKARNAVPELKENADYTAQKSQLEMIKGAKDAQGNLIISQKQYNQASEQLEQQHQVNLAKIRAGQVVTPQQQAQGEVDPVQRLANQHAQELALIQQFETQKGQLTANGLALMNAANTQYEQARIAAQWEIFRNQSTTNELMASAVDGFASQAANSLAGLIDGTQSASEAFRNLGSAIANSVVQALVEVGIQYLKNAAMAMIADKMTSSSSQQAGAQTAAAWAPAAAAASIATFGGAAIAGIAGMVAAFAIGAALAGKRKNGGTVGAGGAYQVGEGNMPELLQTKNGLIMIPGDRGRVFSNKDVTGSSPTIQKASTGKEYLPTSSASSSQSGENSKRPIQVNIQLIDQTTGSQHNITGTDAFQQGDVVTVTGFLNDVDTGGPMSTAIADAHGLRRQARGAF